MLKLGLGNEGAACPTAKDQDVEPAHMVGDDQRVRLERISFEARPDAGDQPGMAQEPPRPCRLAKQRLRQKVRRHIEKE